MLRKKQQTLTHLDTHGRARMVDVADKPVTSRMAVAEATVRMQPRTLALITTKAAAKGDVLAVARVAGIQAAKRTHELIPLCHALLLSSVVVEFDTSQKDALHIVTRVRCKGETGVEMEALTAASIAALTVYDMLKAVERGMVVENVRLLEKAGGRSGHWQR
jgi:cyclic pyranopterin phosphate synthase